MQDKRVNEISHSGSNNDDNNIRTYPEVILFFFKPIENLFADPPRFAPADGFHLLLKTYHAAIKSRQSCAMRPRNETRKHIRYYSWSEELKRAHIKKLEIDASAKPKKRVPEPMHRIVGTYGICTKSVVTCSIKKNTILYYVSEYDRV